MSGLDLTLAWALIDRYDANLARVRELAEPLSENQFWAKPFSYGNSFGNLVLHLTGNLNYYIGAQIANTGYVREREREFTDRSPAAKEDTLEQLDAGVAMVIETIRSQSPTDWGQPYSAVGTSCKNRLDITIQCVAHMQHHIGQMVYLGHEWQKRQDQ